MSRPRYEHHLQATPAAPFHPHGEQPQAPCPQCIQNGDETPKSLYGIRGLDEGEHDQSIPRTWFQCPPIRLDGSAPGMDAVRVSACVII